MLQIGLLNILITPNLFSLRSEKCSLGARSGSHYHSSIAIPRSLPTCRAHYYRLATRLHVSGRSENEFEVMGVYRSHFCVLLTVEKTIRFLFLQLQILCPLIHERFQMSGVLLHELHHHVDGAELVGVDTVYRRLDLGEGWPQGRVGLPASFDELLKDKGNWR